MTGQMQQAEITCQLCGKTVQVNQRNQRMKFCRKCDSKVQKTAVGIQQAIANEKKIERLAKSLEKAKASKKAPVVHIHCSECGKTFICPTCSPTKKVKAKKASPRKTRKTTKPKSTAKKGGATHAKKTS
jgi:hypothetical protein